MATFDLNPTCLCSAIRFVQNCNDVYGIYSNTNRHSLQTARFVFMTQNSLIILFHLTCQTVPYLTSFSLTVFDVCCCIHKFCSLKLFHNDNSYHPPLQVPQLRDLLTLYCNYLQVKFKLWMYLSDPLYPRNKEIHCLCHDVIHYLLASLPLHSSLPFNL